MQRAIRLALPAVGEDSRSPTPQPEPQAPANSSRTQVLVEGAIFAKKAQTDETFLARLTLPISKYAPRGGLVSDLTRKLKAHRFAGELLPRRVGVACPPYFEFPTTPKTQDHMHSAAWPAWGFGISAVENMASSRGPAKKRAASGTFLGTLPVPKREANDSQGLPDSLARDCREAVVPRLSEKICPWHRERLSNPAPKPFRPRHAGPAGDLERRS